MKNQTPSDAEQLTAANSAIAAHTFTPAKQRDTKPKRRYQPLYYVLASLLIIALSALWFIFTAKSLVVTTLPVTEHIDIEGGLYVRWGDGLLVSPGDYKISATQPGYYPLEQSFVVDQQQNQLKHFVFEPLPGKLSLTIAPDVDTRVFIDGEKTELAQGSIESIAAGQRKLLVEADNYFPFQADVNITGKRQRQTLVVKLIPAWGNVMLNSQPLGAQVYQDQLLLGTTPLNVELLQGNHQLRFTKKGYRSSVREIDIVAGQLATLKPVTLFKTMGQLAITTNPSGVNISYGEQFLGTSPLKVEVDPNEQHTLLLFKEGYRSQSHSLKVMSGQTVNKHFNLADDLGEIAFNVSPKDALLYVDGRLMGRAQRQLQLPIKQHSIRIESPGFVSYQATVLPKSTMQQRLDISLKTEEQAKWDNMKPVITAQVGSKLKLFKPNDTLVMGASRREQGRRANEVRRKIQVSKAFYLGVTEITNKQFRQFQRQHSSGHVKGNSLNGTHQPAVKLTWQQAALFCNWLSEKDNLNKVYLVEEGKVIDFDHSANGYRLPTEAEWVWAARLQQGEMLKYPWGSTLPPPQGAGNFADIAGAPILGKVLTNYNDKYVTSAPVGSFKENTHGIYDLAGNVSEWLHDYYQIQTGLSNKTERDPMGPKTGDYHVIRGASWAHGGRTELRLSYRDYGVDERTDLGFRIARNAL